MSTTSACSSGERHFGTVATSRTAGSGTAAGAYDSLGVDMVVGEVKLGSLTERVSRSVSKVCGAIRDSLWRLLVRRLPIPTLKLPRRACSQGSSTLATLLRETSCTEARLSRLPRRLSLPLIALATLARRTVAASLMRRAVAASLIRRFDC